MPTPLGDIFVRIGAKTKDFEQGLDRVQAASAKVFAGISAGIAGIGVIGAGFEKEITKVGALTGATGDTLKDLGATARSVAKETEFTAKQAAEGMSFFAMAGFSAEQAMAALRPATILASTGFIDLGRASDIVTNIMSGFGRSFDELDKSIDVIIKTATSANTTVDMLGEAMSYAAPVAKSFGITFEETAAAMGLLGDAGIQASRAGTNLRMLFAKLAKPAGKAQAILERIGVTVFDSSNKMRPMAEIFGKIAEKGMTAKETMEVFGPRAASAALILTQSMKKSEKSLADFTAMLEKSDGAAEEIFQKMSQTVSFQFNVMKSNFEEAALVLYDQLRPALMGIIKFGQRMAQVFSALSPETLSWITNIALGAAVVSGLGLALATLGKIMLIAFAPGAVAALAFLGIAAAIGAIALIIVDNWTLVEHYIVSLADTIADAFKDLGKLILVTMTAPFKAAWVVINTYFGTFAQAIDGLLDLVGLPAQGFADAWESATTSAAKTIANLVGTSTKELRKYAVLLSKLPGVGMVFQPFIESSGPAKEQKGWSEKGAIPGFKPKEEMGIAERIAASIRSGAGKALTAMGVDVDNAKAKLKAMSKEIEGVDQKMGSLSPTIEGLGEGSKEASGAILAFAKTAPDLSKYAGSLSDELYLSWSMLTEPMQAFSREAVTLAQGFGVGAKAAQQAVLGIATGIQTAVSVMGQSIISNVGGEIGGVIQAGIQGGMAGGPIGAIVAVIMEVVMAFESIMDSIAVADEGLKMIGDAMSPIFDSLVGMNEGINKSLGEMLGALQPLFDVFAGLMGIVSDIIGTFIKAINSVITIIVKVLTPVLELIGLLLEGLAAVIGWVTDAIDSAFKWVEGVVNDVGNAFNDLFGINNDLTLAQRTHLAMVNQQIEAHMALIEQVNAVRHAIGDFKVALGEAVDALIQEKEVRGAFRVADLHEELMRGVESGLGSTDFESLFGTWFDQLTGIGFSADEAERRISEAFSLFDVGGTETWQMLMDAFQKAFDVQDLSDVSDNISDAGSAASDMADAVNEATESLLNIPSGFKLEYAKQMAIDQGTPVAGVNNGVTATSGDSVNMENSQNQVTLNGNINVYPSGYGTDEFAEWWANFLATGTTVPTAPDPGGLGG